MNEKYSVMPLLFAEVLRDRFLKYKIINEEEYEALVNGVEEYTKIDNAIVLYSSIFRVWGSKQSL